MGGIFMRRLDENIQVLRWPNVTVKLNGMTSYDYEPDLRIEERLHEAKFNRVQIEGWHPRYRYVRAR